MATTPWKLLHAGKKVVLPSKTKPKPKPKAKPKPGTGRGKGKGKGKGFAAAAAGVPIARPLGKPVSVSTTGELHITEKQVIFDVRICAYDFRWW